RAVHAHQEGRVADPGHARTQLQRLRIEIDARCRARTGPPRDPQAAGEEGERDAEAGAEGGVLRHRPGVAAILSSTVVPSLSGVGSANATFTDSTRVSVGRPGSWGLRRRRVTDSGISSTRPFHVRPGKPSARIWTGAPRASAAASA